MFNRIFLDANILIDIAGTKRPMHTQSLRIMQWLMQQNIMIYTSCDIMTTVYYINAKESKRQALLNVININKLCSVIEFSNNEVEMTCNLMLEDSDYTDLEDTMQYTLALKEGCELILTNDKNFVSKEIPTMSSEVFVKEYL